VPYTEYIPYIRDFRRGTLALYFFATPAALRDTAAAQTSMTADDKIAGEAVVAYRTADEMGSSIREISADADEGARVAAQAVRVAQPRRQRRPPRTSPAASRRSSPTPPARSPRSRRSRTSSNASANSKPRSPRRWKNRPPPLPK
jgi:hypothetical protein